ncbi:MAG: response regulator [Gammaproteobacteria bacterium]|nr:response regulator [Gammaproteobacteria bacterium]MBT7308081.1 response regulator [Gammaproteobacteria bacterium]
MIDTQQKRIARLLIVDDDPRIQDYYREALTLSRSQDEMENELEIDEMFAILEEDNPLRQESAYCDAYIAAQGLEALRKSTEMIEAGTPFDLALLDMRIPPGIDGLETAKGLRRQNPDLPIIFVTAYSDYREEQLIEQLGHGHKMLHKPIDQNKLREEIRNTLPTSVLFGEPAE